MTVGVDHEYIPENAAKGNTPGPRPDVRTTYCEVMQMGACRLNEAGEEVAVLNQTVSAYKLHFIPPWLSKMTGMTAEKREAEGIPFPEALDMLIDFAGKETPWTFMGDEHVLRRNIAAHGLIWPFKNSFRLVKPMLADYGITIDQYRQHGFEEVNSGNLHTVLGIKLPTIEGVGAHDALHDARSLTHSIHHLTKGK
jgi:hypothetical protein